MTNLYDSIREIMHFKLGYNITLDNNPTHILFSKEQFLLSLIDELAKTFLQYINRLYWNDNYKLNALAANANTRWQLSGVSLESCLEIVQKIAVSMTDFFNQMISLKYNDKYIIQKLELDKEKLIF